MYIRKSTRTYKGKTYINHLLVESVQTAKGPRQRTICSLGSLEPAPAEDWLALAHKLQSALAGDTKPGRSAHVVTKKSYVIENKASDPENRGSWVSSQFRVPEPVTNPDLSDLTVQAGQYGDRV